MSNKQNNKDLSHLKLTKTWVTQSAHEHFGPHSVSDLGLDDIKQSKSGRKERERKQNKKKEDSPAPFRKILLDAS